MLKTNEYMAPAHLFNRGRWYDIFIESDGTASITKADADVDTASISGTYLKLPEGFHIIDYIMDVTTTGAQAAVSVNKALRLYADGCQGITLPDADDYQGLAINIFGYFE